MSDKVTRICCPDRGFNFSSYGARSREYMIQSMREYAQGQLRLAQKILETKDEDFVVYQCNGVHIERNKKFLTHSSQGKGVEG